MADNTSLLLETENPTAKVLIGKQSIGGYEGVKVFATGWEDALHWGFTLHSSLSTAQTLTGLLNSPPGILANILLKPTKSNWWALGELGIGTGLGVSYMLGANVVPYIPLLPGWEGPFAVGNSGNIHLHSNSHTTHTAKGHIKLTSLAGLTASGLISASLTSPALASVSGGVSASVTGLLSASLTSPKAVEVFSGGGTMVASKNVTQLRGTDVNIGSASKTPPFDPEEYASTGGKLSKARALLAKALAWPKTLPATNLVNVAAASTIGVKAPVVHLNTDDLDVEEADDDADDGQDIDSTVRLTTDRLYSRCSTDAFLESGNSFLEVTPERTSLRVARATHPGALLNVLETQRDGIKAVRDGALETLNTVKKKVENTIASLPTPYIPEVVRNALDLIPLTARGIEKVYQAALLMAEDARKESLTVEDLIHKSAIEIEQGKVVINAGPTHITLDVESGQILIEQANDIPAGDTSSILLENGVVTVTGAGTPEPSVVLDGGEITISGGDITVSGNAITLEGTNGVTLEAGGNTFTFDATGYNGPGMSEMGGL